MGVNDATEEADFGAGGYEITVVVVLVDVLEIVLNVVEFAGAVL